MPATQGPLHIFAAVVVGVSLIGFFAGTRTEDYTLETPLVHHEPVNDPDVPQARAWSELARTPRGTSSGWEVDIAALQAGSPSVLDDVALDGTSKGAALGERAGLRAYDGAPPQIPHAIRQDSAPECLACHDAGLRLRERLAPPMSHRELTSCTQCHVVAEQPMPGGAELPPDPRAVDNAFTGMPSPTQGPRAWDVAPPQIPHQTHMRERCESCHGTNGRDAIRSSHPYRQACEQCHAPSAELDQRPGLE